MPLTPISKLFIYGMWADYYREAAERVVAKLADNYGAIDIHGKMGLVKLAVDNIERLKAVLHEVSRLKYTPIHHQMYINLAHMLSTLERMLLTRRYGDKRPNSVRRIKEDLSYIAYTLDNFREDLTHIISGEKIPLWYSNIRSDEYVKLSRFIAQRYYKLFKEPLSVMVYLS